MLLGGRKQSAAASQWTVMNAANGIYVQMNATAVSLLHYMVECLPKRFHFMRPPVGTPLHDGGDHWSCPCEVTGPGDQLEVSDIQGRRNDDTPLYTH
jgi:hypothetical protein